MGQADMAAAGRTSVHFPAGIASGPCHHFNIGAVHKRKDSGGSHISRH
ncbi:MAG: hypothetical protein LBK13_04125 [Spirochaetales bacterium]|nr:hypothetical protein [Spirochaetales bacterium]